MKKQNAQPASGKKWTPGELAADNAALRREIRALRAKERQWIRGLGKDLHDGLCQDLAAIAFYTECLRTEEKRGRREQFAKLLQRLSDVVNKAMNGTHELASRLLVNPPSKRKK